MANVFIAIRRKTLIKVYSTGCPQCKVLEAKLANKNVDYIKIDDMEQIKKMGFVSVPYLVIDDQDPMNFSQAVKWVNSLEE